MKFWKCLLHLLFLDQFQLHSYKNIKITKVRNWNWAQFLCGYDTQSINQGEERNWGYWDNKCVWGDVWTEVQREKERENVGNRISQNIITVIRAEVLTVNIGGLHKRSKHIQKYIVWNSC
jgi:hypothetical protein